MSAATPLRPYVARVVAPAKWAVPPGFAPSQIGADAVTAELRTLGNTLSTWETSADAADLAEVALAFAATRNRLDKIELLPLAKAALARLGIQHAYTSGDTRVPDLRGRHVDLIALDLLRLVRLARLIAAEVRADRSYPFTRHQVGELLAAAVVSGRLAPGELDPRLLAELIERRFLRA
jgi:hypothetical protein